MRASNYCIVMYPLGRHQLIEGYYTFYLLNLERQHIASYVVILSHFILNVLL